MARKALIHQIEARERRGRWFGALATLLSISLLLSGWVGLFAFLGANSAYGTFEEVKNEWVPDTRSMELTLPDLSRVSRIFADSGEVLAELHDGRNSEPVPYADVPDTLVYAILAAEDSGFFEHEGIDFQAIMSAAIDNLISDRTRGGSTITQQVVKNAFVGSEVSIQRKVTEAFVAAEVEKRFPKERILEYYMNSVYFGAGAYGVKTAAEEFFAKEMDQLSISEAATLSVMVRNPSLYNPRRRPEVTLERRDQVIREMEENGWITEAEADAAIEEPLGVVDAPLRRGQADHVVAEVKRQLLNDPEFAFLGDSPEERKKAVFGCPADDVACEGGGGLQVFTTIDLELQQKANEILASWLPLPPYEENLAKCKEVLPNETDDFLARYAETHSCVPTGAMTMVDNWTGAYKLAGMLFGNHRVKVHRTHPPIHESEFALHFVRRLGGAAVMANLSPQLHVDEHTRERVAARIRNELGSAGPLFGVHPGNGASAFNWPVAHYIELINRLALHGRVMITGSAAERPLLADIRARLSGSAETRVACFTDFDLGELAAALSSLTALTASSTGPMHMAGILETPVVALFSPHPVHAPEKWAPLGQKHTVLVASLEADEDARVPRHRGEEVMSRIRVDDVLAANLQYAEMSPAGGITGWARAS